MNGECPICMNITNNIITTKCGHKFCKSCINVWLSKHNLCPSCRQPISNEFKNNISSGYMLSSDKMKYHEKNMRRNRKKDEKIYNEQCKERINYNIYNSEETL